MRTLYHTLLPPVCCGIHTYAIIFHWVNSFFWGSSVTPWSHVASFTVLFSLPGTSDRLNRSPSRPCSSPQRVQDLGWMLTLHYRVPPHTQCPQWTTQLYLSLLRSQLCLFLSHPLFLRHYHRPTTPITFPLHTCAIDRISGLQYELTRWHGVNRQSRVCFRPETVTL